MIGNWGRTSVAMVALPSMEKRTNSSLFGFYRLPRGLATPRGRGKTSRLTRAVATDIILVLGEIPKHVMNAVFEALSKERPLIAAYYELLFFTGVRRSKPLEAEWKDLDLKKAPSV